MRQIEEQISIQDSSIPVLDATLRVRHYHHDKALAQSGPQQVSPLLVFLHEGLGCVEMWKDFPQQVCAATGLSGIAYDRQGYGQSTPFTHPRRPNYLHIEAYDYLPALLFALEVDQVILIGHSDGGTIALLFAGAYPQKTCCLVTMAAHVFVETETVQGIAQAKEDYQSSTWPQKLAKYHADKTDAVFYAWTDTWLSSEFTTWNIEKELLDIQSPILVMQGVEDIYGTCKQVESIVHNSQGPAQPLWVPDCGHVPHLEARETTIAAVTEFIAAHVPDRQAML